MLTSWFFLTIPADTDVFKTSSGRLKKVTTSYDQTRRRYDVWKMTSDLRLLEDVWFTSSWRRPIYNVLKSLIYDVFRTSGFQRPQDVWFTSSWRRLICDVWKTSDLQRLQDICLRRFEDVRFTLSWRRPMYNILKTSDLWRIEEVWFMTSWRRLLNNICVATS